MNRQGRSKGKTGLPKSLLAYTVSETGKRIKNPAYTKAYREFHAARRGMSVYEANLRCNLMRLYGMTLEQYNDRVRAQSGVCAICGHPPSHSLGQGQHAPRLLVDHNHSTGAVRGLLCHSCNILIGMLESFQRDQRAGLIQSALAYLERHNDTTEQG